MLPTLHCQQDGLIYSPTCSYGLIITIKTVLRHSSPLHPHHLLDFAKFASDLWSHKQDENQSPWFPGELELTKGNKKRTVSKNGLGLSLPAFRSVYFGAAMTRLAVSTTVLATLLVNTELLTSHLASFVKFR